MMLSLFRADRPRTELDHLAAMDIATTAEDLDMITWAFVNEKAAMVALDGLPTIIKPTQAGDDGLSYVGLFDTALTLREFRRMKEHKVQDPTKLKDALYRITLIIEVNRHPTVACLIRATDEVDFDKKIHRLLDASPEFREALINALVHVVITSSETSLVTAGPLKMKDPAPDDAPEFEFLTPHAD